MQLTGGYLGASVAATPFQPGETPIPNLYPPKASSAAERDRQMQRARQTEPGIPRALRHQLGHRGPRPGLRTGRAHAACTRRRSSISPRSREHVKELYGIGEKETDDFGRQLLLARRLAENGVRFIQICHAGGGNGAWDAHGDMKTHAPLCRADRQADCRPDPRPEAARHAGCDAGGLDQRVRPQPVVAEHDRPRSQSQAATPSWLAGGGVKGGIVHGATDEVGYQAVENRHYYSDLHATILHQLGLDYKKMEVTIAGPNLPAGGRRARADRGNSHFVMLGAARSSSQA